MPDTDVSREVAEWDWITIGPGNVLHAPATWHDPDQDMHDTHATTECGITGWGHVPGLGARASAARCDRCCAHTGMPPGRGSPKNVDECRPIAAARIAALPATRQEPTR